MIVACSLGMGLGVTVLPEIFKVLPSVLQLITSNGIVAGSLTAIILNIVFNMIPWKRESLSMEAQQELDAVNPRKQSTKFSEKEA
ncbi:MAG: purine permease, partial [Candidatus Kurthia intestinigallinarum]